MEAEDDKGEQEGCSGFFENLRMDFEKFFQTCSG
jgi:hypothetical protein